MHSAKVALSIRPLAAVLLVLASPLVSERASAALKTSCHIHSPQQAMDKDQRLAIVGPFSNRADCETERGSRFGELGRCHCSAGFASPWDPLGRLPVAGALPKNPSIEPMLP
jgi:hypothetical protein